jgi:hypothetical protein
MNSGLHRPRTFNRLLVVWLKYTAPHGQQIPAINLAAHTTHPLTDLLPCSWWRLLLLWLMRRGPLSSTVRQVRAEERREFRSPSR